MRLGGGRKAMALFCGSSTGSPQLPETVAGSASGPFSLDSPSPSPFPGPGVCSAL